MLSNSSLISQSAIDLVIKPDDSNGSSYNPFIAMLPDVGGFNDGDIPHIQLTQFSCYNNFYNISAGLQNNILKIVTVVGTNGMNYVKSITIPDGNYNMKTLLAYLNGTGTNNVSAQWVFPRSNAGGGVEFTSVTDPSNNYYEAIYTGLGWDNNLSAVVCPDGYNVTSVLTPRLDSNNPLTTVVLPFSVDTNNIVTVNTPPKNVYHKSYLDGYSSVNDPYSVNAIGLIDDDETTNLLTLLGFKNTSTLSVKIPYCNLWGYYVTVYEDVATTTASMTNNNIVGIRNYTLGGVDMLYFGLVNIQNENYSNDKTLNNLNVVASMPFQAAYGEMFVYEPANSHPIRISNANVEFFQCVILDQDLKRINFNGLRWHATFRISFTSNGQYLQSELNQGFHNMVLPNQARMPESIRHNANQPARDGSGRKRSRLLDSTNFFRHA